MKHYESGKAKCIVCTQEIIVCQKKLIFHTTECKGFVHKKNLGHFNKSIDIFTGKEIIPLHIAVLY